MRIGSWLGPAALLLFAVCNGTSELVFGARVPEIRGLTELGLSQMGLLLGGFGLGLLVGSALSTALLDRLGTRPVVIGGALLYWTPILAIGLVIWQGPRPGVLAAWIAVLWGVAGFGNGLMDPCQSLIGAAMTHTGGRQFSQLPQAAQALGTLVAAGVAWADAGVPVQVHFAAVGALTLLIGTTAAVGLPNIRQSVTHDAGGPEVGVRGLLLLALVVIASVAPLGTALGWITTVLQERRAPAAIINSGLLIFTGSQLAGVLLDFRLSDRSRPEKRGRVFVAVALAGIVALIVATLLPDGPVSVGLAAVGLGLMGLGVSPVPGLAIQAAHEVRVARLGPGARVGLIATAAFLGVPIAQSAIGQVGQLLGGATWAFLAVNAVCVIGTLLGAGLFRYGKPDGTAGAST